MNKWFFIVLAVVCFLGPGSSQARLYNVSTGRFLTMDTYEGNKQEPQTLHKYGYASNDPINGTDPTGNYREINSGLEAGKIAEEPVVLDFTGKRKLNALSQLSVHGLVLYASTTGYKGVGRLRPDLVDGKLYEIYDVKSWKEVGAGMEKIQDYVVALNLADYDPKRAIKWHAGLTYNYGGPNPVLMPGISSNGKQVWAMYFPTEAGVVPYKLYEVDNDQDRKRIPVPVMVNAPQKVQDSELERSVYTQPVGTMIYANYYSRTMSRNIAVTGSAVLLGAMGVATLNAIQGGAY